MKSYWIRAQSVNTNDMYIVGEYTCMLHPHSVLHHNNMGEANMISAITSIEEEAMETKRDSDVSFDLN